LIRRFGQNTDLGIPPAYPFLAIFYGTGTPPHFHLQPAVLWFFPCLFTAQLLTYFAYRAGPWRTAGWSLAMGVVGFLLPKWLALPMELETALVAQIFIALGIWARRVDLLARVRARWLLCVLSLALGTVLALLNERVDVRVSTYGNAFLFFGASLALSLGLALAAQPLPGNRVSDAVARNTILIFPLHPFLFTVFTGIFILVFHWDATLRNLPAVTLTTTILNCTLIVLSAPLFRKMLPMVYGLSNKDAGKSPR
jgi:fucose 4-O-acetylase-like acetyltransferase